MTRILIIDDDPDIVESLTMVLEAHDYEVQHLNTTRDLVEHVTKAAPDLIVLDVIFPEDHQAGFKAARTLAQDETLRRVPVVMLSAVNQRSSLAFAFSESDISGDFMPVQVFLEKLIQPVDLLSRIKALLTGP